MLSRTSLLLRAAIRRPALVVAIAGSVLAYPVVGQDKAVPAAVSPPAAAPVKTAAKPAERIDTLKRIRDTGAITLGVREASVPFSFIDAQKQPQGYSVDLCMRVADAIKADLKLPKLEVKFVPVSSSDRISMLVAGKIDLECGSTTNTRDRQQQVAFAYTTFVAGIKMLAKRSANISSIEDLRGKDVVVTKGTTSEKILVAMNADRLLKMNIIVSRDHGKSFKAGVRPLRRPTPTQRGPDQQTMTRR